MNADVCIIGAGLAGLSAAQALYKAGVDFCLIEADSQPGGRVQTGFSIIGARTFAAILIFSL